jgi:hypothetical protein
MNNGRRQPSRGGTSRMNREVHVRNLWEARGEIPRAYSAFTSFSTPSDHVGSYPNNDQTGDALRRSKRAISVVDAPQQFSRKCWLPRVGI